MEGSFSGIVKPGSLESRDVNSQYGLQTVYQWRLLDAADDEYGVVCETNNQEVYDVASKFVGKTVQVGAVPWAVPGVKRPWVKLVTKWVKPV